MSTSGAETGVTAGTAVDETMSITGCGSCFRLASSGDVFICDASCTVERMSKPVVANSAAALPLPSSSGLINKSHSSKNMHNNSCYSELDMLHISAQLL